MRDARTVTGHAVRQLYLLAGVTDLAAETGDAALRETAVRLWDAMTESKTSLTGGLGSRHELESFGDPYELPPDRAYNETCAAIASVQWSWRTALLTGEARYSDLVERTLFNGFAAGCGLDGDSWLYVNPLQVREDYEGHRDDQSARRTPWFRCACCPPNAMRLLASLPHYMASEDDDGVQLHQYATGVYGRVSVETDYPWDGRIAVTAGEARRLDAVAPGPRVGVGRHARRRTGRDGVAAGPPPVAAGRAGRPGSAAAAPAHPARPPRRRRTRLCRRRVRPARPLPGVGGPAPQAGRGAARREHRSRSGAPPLAARRRHGRASGRPHSGAVRGVGEPGAGAMRVWIPLE